MHFWHIGVRSERSCSVQDVRRSGSTRRNAVWTFISARQFAIFSPPPLASTLPALFWHLSTTVLSHLLQSMAMLYSRHMKVHEQFSNFPESLPFWRGAFPSRPLMAGYFSISIPYGGHFLPLCDVFWNHHHFYFGWLQFPCRRQCPGLGLRPPVRTELIRWYQCRNLCGRDLGRGGREAFWGLSTEYLDIVSTRVFERGFYEFPRGLLQGLWAEMGAYWTPGGTRSSPPIIMARKTPVTRYFLDADVLHTSWWVDPWGHCQAHLK